MPCLGFSSVCNMTMLQLKVPSRSYVYVKTELSLYAGAHGITWSCTSTATARGRRSRAGSSHSSKLAG